VMKQTSRAQMTGRGRPGTVEMRNQSSVDC
jgi:hypothetical protein